jgi:tetratricopeptide (TPR) repeat protein
MLLGNIYVKHENNLRVAEYLYKKAYALNPDDPYLLTNLGALFVEMDKKEIAQDYFTRAIKIDSSYPKAYYGLALLNANNEHLEDAIHTLEELFTKPRSDDKRLWPVYAQARVLYLDVNKKIVERSYSSLMSTLETRKQGIEQETGVHIEIVEDNSLKSIFAVAESARRHDRDTHIIRYRNIDRRITPHLIAHELEHLYMEEQTRAVGRNRFFATTAQTREHAIRSVGDYIFQQQKRGHSESIITEVTLQLVNGLARQLHSCPLDMMVEYRLYSDLETLHPSQFLSLVYNHTQSLKTITDPEIRKNSPRQIFQASVALNYAYALFCDSLYPKAANFAEPYRISKLDSVAHVLFDTWQQIMQSYHPGDEYTLVDEFAHVLKLEDWFEWKADTSQQPQPEGPTNPELLKEQEPATMMYCLGALQYFQGMDKEEVFTVGSEIGLLVMSDN